jgi:hypothetical protein
VKEELLHLPDWSSRLNRALLELPHKLRNREEHVRTALTAVAGHISSVLQYQYSGTLLSGEVTLVRPADESEDNCGLTKVTFQFCLCTMITLEACTSIVVEALCYKPEGHGFYSR